MVRQAVKQLFGCLQKSEKVFTSAKWRGFTKKNQIFELLTGILAILY